MKLDRFLMRFFSRVRTWVRAVAHRNQLESEMEAELACHLELLTADLIRAGLSPEEAARRAHIAFGTTLTHREGMRFSLGLHWWDELWADLRYGIRILRKSSTFTAVAATSLALAIGANTAIFSVAREFLYSRLHVPHPEQLRLLGWRFGQTNFPISFGTSHDVSGMGMTSDSFSYPVFRSMRDNDRALSGLIAFMRFRGDGRVGGNALPVTGELVSGNYFSVLGIQAQIGRLLQPSDDGELGKGTVTVISDALWQKQFGRSPAALGQTIVVNHTPLTIVGIASRGFTGARSAQSGPDMFVPFSMQPQVNAWSVPGPPIVADPRSWLVNVMGRVRPGTDEQQTEALLNAELAAAVHATMQVDPGQTIPHLVVVDGSQGQRLWEASFKKPVNVLLALGAAVLLLACANLANLLLARGIERQRELSVRLALGATRGRLFRQLLTESFAIAVLGGVGGFVVGYLSRNSIPNLLRGGLQAAPGVPFDWTVAAFAAAVTLVTGMAFGLIPGYLAVRAEAGASLKRNTHTATRRHGQLGGYGLVSVQIALSTLLLIGTGLFLRTLARLSAVDTGFRTDQLLLATVRTPRDGYPGLKGVALHERVEQTLASVPGVESVAPMDIGLLSGNSSTITLITEAEVVAHSEPTNEFVNEVGNNFFHTMGIPILAGRTFGSQDTAASPRVAVINRAMAQRHFVGMDPIGKRFTFGSGKSTQWIEVVGVCADTRFRDLRQAAPPQVFLPYVQSELVLQMTYAIRTPLATGSIAPELRRAVQSVDPDLPITSLFTQQEEIREDMRPERAMAAVTTGFALLALALACVGIYGVMAYSVAQRTNEIGIRLALGADPGSVRRMILRESTVVTAIGIVAGLAGALAFARLVKSMLYGVMPNDPLTIMASVALLLVVALAASWIPARRAAGVQPMEALRHE